ncbi:MAG: hypothetical protein CMM59_23850 [Rhodospirillaceae bacterium]|nr:hypothetical protein [Rhodospirillaceae bacterium]
MICQVFDGSVDYPLQERTTKWAGFYCETRNTERRPGMSEQLTAEQMEEAQSLQSEIFNLF